MLELLKTLKTVTGLAAMAAISINLFNMAAERSIEVALWTMVAAILSAAMHLFFAERAMIQQHIEDLEDMD